MKRLLSLFTILCCVFSFVTFPVAVKAEVVTFSDNFQTETDTVPDNWSVAATSLNTTATVETENGNKFLRLAATAQRWSSALPSVVTKENMISVPLTDKEVLIKYKTRMSSENSTKIQFYMRAGVPGGASSTTEITGNNYKVVEIRRNGDAERTSLYYYTTNTWPSEHTGISFNKDVWYEVEALINPTDETIVYTVGNETDGYITLDAKMEINSLSSLELIDNLAAVMCYANAGAYMDIDDVYVGYPEETEVPETPEVPEIPEEPQEPEEVVNKERYILYDDFESDGTTPQNWQLYSGTLATVEVKEEENNSFLRLKATEGVVNNGSNTAKQPIAITKPGVMDFKLSETEKLVIKAKLRHNETGSGNMSSLRLGYPYPEANFTDTVSGSYAIFGFRENTVRHLDYDGSHTQSWLDTVASYTTSVDKWYDTTTVINPADMTYTLTITDGTNTKTATGNMTRTGTDSFFNELDLVKSLALKITGASSSSTYMDADDVIVYKVYTSPKADLVADNGYIAANASSVNVKFDKDMDEATLTETTVLLEDADGGELTYEGSYDKETKTYKIVPDEALIPGETYYVKLDEEIYANNIGEIGDTEYDGGKLTGTKEFSFVVAAPKSDNARLSAITVNGEEIADFDGDTTAYTVKLMYADDLEMPVVTATTEDAKAKAPQITYPDEVGKDITIKSVAEDGITEIIYTVSVKLIGKEMAKLGENLVVNPGFETGNLDGYTSMDTFKIESSTAHTGSYSGKSVGRTNPQSGFYRQNVNVKANRTYLLSAWFKTSSGTQQYEIYPNTSNVERPYRESETVAGSPTEWTRVILTIVPKIDTPITPSVLSWTTTEDYYVDDIYVGEIKPSVVYNGINTVAVDRSKEVRSELKADIVNQFGTKNGLASAEITEWRIVSAPYGVSTSGNELIVSREAEAGTAVIDIVFEPNYVGANRVLDEDVPEWTKRIEITVTDDTEPIPYAKELKILGEVVLDGELEADYRYYHNGGVDEKLPANIVWLYSDSANGTYNEIPEATGEKYIVEEDYVNKFIRVKVTPEAIDGTVGPSATSNYVCAQALPTATVTVETPQAYAVGDTLKGDYVYSDINLDKEGETTFRWLRFNKETEKYEAIVGATGKTYVLTEDDCFTKLKFEVKPVSTKEPTSAEDNLFYSEEINGPDKPYIENLKIKVSGKIATVSYDYKHPNGVAEGATIIKWTVDGKSKGEGASCIASESSTIKVEVTPVASKEPSKGETKTATKKGESTPQSGGGGGGKVTAGSIVILPEVTVTPEKSEQFLTGSEANHWGASAIEWAIAGGYMEKEADGLFNPDMEYNRQNFLTSVLKMVGMKGSLYKDTFKDVEKGEFANLLQSAVDAGIISVDENFNPQRNVSREEVCKIIVTSLTYMGLDKNAKGDITKFTDSAEIGAWAEEYIAKMLGTGLMVGTDDGRFMPKGTLTKAQTATILRRLSEYVENVKEGK
ncbi:MAG: S-layer homology domain-containing protein [Clostridia bacterium]|nr:S-layer homology domain-containing protein [Clostridia bacterium]